MPIDGGCWMARRILFRRELAVFWDDKPSAIR